KRIYLYMMTGLLSVFAFIGVTHAQAGMQHDADKHSRMFERIVKRLDLTEEQQTAFELLREQFTAEQKPLKEQLRATRDELNGLSTVDNYDEDAVADLADQLGELTKDMAIGHLSFRNQLQLLLTEDQRAQMAEFHKKKGNKMERKARHMEKRQERMERRQARHEAQAE
ncbi:MAG: Spy/CpxP family protein refolding chaperone, partial [Pseudomonadales bacterium]